MCGMAGHVMKSLQTRGASGLSVVLRLLAAAVGGRGHVPRLRARDRSRAALQFTMQDGCQVLLASLAPSSLLFCLPGLMIL